MRFASITGLAFLVSAASLDCSSARDGSTNDAGGNGGATSSGGSAASSNGASTGSGASTTTSTGGAIDTGGAPATSGGASSTSGGTTSTGGAPSAGGAGATANGGTTSTGGGANTGGTASDGGTTNGGAGGANASGGTGGTGCAIPTEDVSKPPTTLALSGDLGTHDPSAIFADGVYYLFATGNGIATKTSTNLLDWRGTPDVFSSIPSWVAGKLSGVSNVWAPDISFFNGVYHLYYAVSTFGSNKSCIGHATRASLGSGSWTDHGAVICSNVGTTDDFNAIDPNIIVDDDGTPWLDFGSFWSGVKLVKLAADGTRADTVVSSLADNKSIEGPYIVHQCGYYYLFVSFGSCCGSPYDYNIRVGRSASVSGPYVDKAGTDMMNGGGNLLVQGNGTWTAPGHDAVLVTSQGAYNLYHALDANHQNPTLRIAELVLDAEGWPVSGGP
ncbi:MAG TPA: arabinan endo-1,5-alpha-L-arabinosidase [Polyangiaceae bacterium]|nr:arabinan endo-1,5-alpha-L-arabinosidase [Polyangiaceae bacterium]